MFGVLTIIIVGSIINAFLCLVFDVSFDSELGMALSSVSMLVAVPFVPIALKVTDKFAIPIFTGISCAFVA